MDTFSKYKKLCGAYGQGHHMKLKQFGLKDKDGLYHIMHSLKYIIHKYIVNLSRQIIVLHIRKMENRSHIWILREKSFNLTSYKPIFGHI